MNAYRETLSLDFRSSLPPPVFDPNAPFDSSPRVMLLNQQSKISNQHCSPSVP